MKRAAGAAIILLASIGAAAAGDDPSALGPTIRDVTPPGITPAPKVDGPLERIPAPPRPPEPPRWNRFYLPETSDAATFVTEGRTIRVAGVTAPSPDEVCRRDDGSEWPCGRAALTGLRMFLRGRAVECHYPPGEDAREVVAPCRVGPTDIGAWLLAAGWARPGEQASDAYRSDAEGALCAGRGLYDGMPRPGSCGAR